MAISLKLSSGKLRQFEAADSIEVDSLERRSGSGNITIGSALGATEQILLASAASAGVRILSDLDVDGDLNVDGTSTIVTGETVQGTFAVEGNVDLGNNDGDIIDLGGGTSDFVNLNTDMALGAGVVTIGSSATDYLAEAWLVAVNNNGPNLDAYNLVASGTNAGAYSIGVDASLLSSTTATDLMTALDDIDAAIAAGGNNLQQAYATGNSIAVTSANGTVDVSNDTDTDITDCLTVSRTPTASTAGEALVVTMGANCTGDALFVNNSGSGDALDIQDGGVSVFQVTGAGAVNVTPTSGQSLTMTVAGAGTVDVNAAGAITLDSTGAGIALDGAGNSNFSTSSGTMTVAAATDVTVQASGADIILDAVAASADGTVT
ncbi:MAG: hypothetical protein GF334_05990, partial [Candidatus Altiarchaeales archaeon]|nr:hypothetical protein [Candidatus Altiarchaeales archaeon]